MKTMNQHQHKFIILCGFSFAGKSTLADALAQRFGYTQIDVDVVKEQLFGIHVQDERLTPHDWARLYHAADQAIIEHLRTGATVIDASRNFTGQERQSAQQLADQANVPLVTIFVDMSETLVRQRWLANQQHPTRRHVSEQDFLAILHGMEPPTSAENPLIFRNGDPIDDWIATHFHP